MLIRKGRAPAEVYNDLQSDVVTLFRVLRDPALSAELVRLVELTPFSREEFLKARKRREWSGDVDRAWCLLVRSWMAHGTNAARSVATSGFRNHPRIGGSSPAMDWANFPQALEAVSRRFRGVCIENKDAVAVMRDHDRPDTLFLVDPPYHPSTRDKGADYDHELDAEGHERLLAAVREMDGMVMLCGYRSREYDRALKGWKRHDFAALADGGKRRTECVWVNPALEKARPQQDLFAAA